MVSAASGASPEAVFSIRAQDLASKVIKQFGETVGNTTKQLSLATRIIQRLTSNILLMGLVIPLVFGLLNKLISPAVQNLLEFEQATRRARFQLRFMGLSVESAHKSIALFSLELDRATSTTLFQNKEAMAAIAIAGEDLGLKMAFLARDLHDKFGIPVAEAFNAIAEARLLNDPQPLIDLIGNFGEMSLEMKQASKDGNSLIEFLQKLSDEENKGAVQRLNQSMRNLAELTLPSKELITTYIAEFYNIFIASLVKHMRDNSGGCREGPSLQQWV